MVITSYGFLLFFLPLALLIYWRVPYKLPFLCIVSYLFYALGSLIFVPLLLGLSLATFYLAGRSLTGWGIALNLITLAFFKYWNFGVDSINALGTAIGIQVFLPLLTLALPLGISFYVFKHIGYLLDVRAGRYRPLGNRLLFITYSAFFPQISAGPMSVTDDTIKQLADLPQKADSEMIYRGLCFISVGLIKKLLIADWLNSALSTGLFVVGDGGSGIVWAWTSVSIYALQLYFDFSAYTDIVLGIGYLLGITLLPNFNNPYHATSPADFWTRWHISLSTWFRFYLFFPLSRSLLRRWGTKHSETAQYVSNFTTMGLIGLWHGAGWGFVLWGLYHGLLLNGFAWAKRRRIPVERRLLLILSVLIGWALFLSPDLNFTAHLISNMFGVEGIGSLAALLGFYSPYTLLVASIALFLTMIGYVEATNLPLLKRPVYAVVLGMLAAFCLIHLGEVTEFIYIQF